MTLAGTFSAVALVCYAALMHITVRHDIRNRTNRAFVVYLASMTFWQFTALMVSLSKDDYWALFWYRLMTPGIVGPFIFFLLFTMVFLGVGERRPWSYAGYIIFAGLLGSSATGLVIRDVTKPAFTDIYIPTLGPLVPLITVTTVVFLGYGVYSLIQGFRRSTSNLHRNRIKYLLLAAAVITLGSFSNLTEVLQGYGIDVAANVVSAFLIAYVILRHQLLDIVVVIRKGLLYSFLAAIVGTAYFLIIFLTTQVFHAFAGPQMVIISVVVAILAAVAAEPLRDRAQYWIDRLFFRERYDSNVMLQRLSRSAAAVLDLDELTDMILDEVSETVHISRAAFFIKDEQSGSFRLMAQRGLVVRDSLILSRDHPVIDWLSSHDAVLTSQELQLLPQFKALWGREWEDLRRMEADLFLPLTARGELVGVFTVGPKLSEESHSHDDQITLATLANQVAMAIDNARLFEEARRRANELAAAVERLQELDRLKSEFMQNASHELRTPLALVMGYAEMLDSGELGEMPAVQQEAIGVIARRAQMMRDLVQDMLLILEVEATPPKAESVQLDELAQTVTVEFQVAASQAGLTLQADIPPRLPPVVGTPTYLRRVLDNLIGNAVKYTPEGGRITVRLRRNGEQVALNVSDTGIGIPEDQLDRIFDRFYQVDGSATRAYSGVGLGLALVKQMAEAYGGHVRVESNQGEGSSFTVSLPVADGAA